MVVGGRILYNGTIVVVDKLMTLGVGVGGWTGVGSDQIVEVVCCYLWTMSWVDVSWS